MNALFDLCVAFLEWLAQLVGMTYKEINIWIFVVLEPVIFILLVWIIIRQRRKIKSLRIRIRNNEIKK